MTVLFFSTQVHSSIMNVEFLGSINLSPLGSDSRTSLNGSFEFDSNSTSPLTDFHLTIGNDQLLLNDGIDLFKQDLNFGPVDDILLVSSGSEGLDGSILGNEIRSMWGIFGFNDNEMMNELIQHGNISPSVLTFSKLIFTYKKHPGIFGSRPLFARIDSINVSAVPLPTGFTLMLSGLGLFLLLIFSQHRKSVQERNFQWQASALL